MERLLERLARDYPTVKFVAGQSFYWSPSTRQVFYKLGDSPKPWSVLHEVAHALLGHLHYSTDYELLRLEIAAWEEAKNLAKRYKITIDDSHVQNCIDSYRDWLYKRSLCPNCGTHCMQCDDGKYYQCFNCHSRWQVTSSRLCRPYRHCKNEQKSPTNIVAGDSV